MIKKNIAGAVILVIACTLFTSLAQLLMKIGMNNFSMSLIGIMADYALLAGLASYGVGMILMVLALKTADLSLVYPFLSLSFIWVLLFSFFVLKEQFMLVQGVGVALIILGVSFVGWGAKS